MFAGVRVRCLSAAAAVLVVLTSAGAAGAGWVVIRNDTNRVVVVQETVTSNGQPMRCKPVRLLPGESVKAFQPNGASIKVEVFDGQNPTRNLYSGNQTSREKDQTFSITSDGKTVTLSAVATKDEKK
jgi:hypothetical protein